MVQEYFPSTVWLFAKFVYLVQGPKGRKPSAQGQQAFIRTKICAQGAQGTAQGQQSNVKFSFFIYSIVLI